MAPANQTSPATPQFQTDLAETPLPEILVTIHRYRAPGVVECRRGEAVKRIYLDGGRVVFATTNQVSESVGDRLLAAGRITREQYDETVRRLKAEGKRHGIVLIEMGILTHDEVSAAVREQIQEIIWSVFNWPDGTVSFVPGRDKSHEFVRVEIPVPEAIVAGVRRMTDARGVVSRLGNRATVYQRTGEVLRDLTFSAPELTLLDAVNGKRTLFELVNTPGLGAAENAQLLYAYLVLRLVAPRESRQIKVQIATDGSKLNG